MMINGRAFSSQISYGFGMQDWPVIPFFDVVSYLILCQYACYLVITIGCQGCLPPGCYDRIASHNSRSFSKDEETKQANKQTNK